MCLTNLPLFRFNKMHFLKLHTARSAAPVTKQGEDELSSLTAALQLYILQQFLTELEEANCSFSVSLSTSSVVTGGLAKSISLAKVSRICKCICLENSSLICLMFITHSHLKVDYVHLMWGNRRKTL